MEEWQKLLASAGMGFAAGVLAEPVKAWIKTRIEVHEAENLLIDEIEMLAGQSKLLLELYQASVSKVLPGPGVFQFRLQRYPYLQENRKGLLVRIKGYGELQKLFEWISVADGRRELTTGEVGNILF